MKAVEDLASHRRAASLKGALFQLYVAASRSRNPAGLMVAQLNVRDEMTIDRNDRHIGRLHYGALAYLAAQAEDEDIAELGRWYLAPIYGRWYLAPIYDVGQACDLALHDRSTLIQDAGRQPATPPELP